MIFSYCLLSGGCGSIPKRGSMSRITISKSDYTELVKVLKRGADIIYSHSPTISEQNVARRMRLIKGKIERKLL